MRSIALGFFALIMVLQAAAQDTNVVINREAYKMKLTIDKKTGIETDIKVSPWFTKENALQIFPGEEIYLEAELDNGKIKSVKVVKENLHPENTIAISFSQVVENQAHSMMMLRVTNPFKQNLAYKAKIRLDKPKDKWVASSVLPIKPGITSYETWPEILTGIELTDWSLQGN